MHKIRSVLFLLSFILLVIGLICSSASTVASLGYWLYLWGELSLPISYAAWSAFLFGVKFFFSGIAAMFIGALGMNYFE